MFFSNRNWRKRAYWQRHYFWRKRLKALEKKLGCKFIRIDTSNAKNGYGLAYEVGNVQAFIGEFKNKKTRKKINKRKRTREKLEKEMREKLEKEMREKLEKELKQKLEKEL